MRPQTLAIALALLAATTSLAGCLEGEDPPAATNEDDPSAPGAGTGNTSPGATGSAPGQPNAQSAGNATPDPALALSTCIEQLGIFPVPAAVFAQGLPEGFDPVALDPAGATTGLVAIAVGCETAVLGNETWGPVQLVAGAILVEPPEDRTSSQADDHALLSGAYTSDARLAGALQRWGLGVYTGELMVQTLVEDGLRVGQASATGDGPTLQLEVQSATATAGEADYQVRLFSGDGTGAVDWAGRGGLAATHGSASLVMTEAPGNLDGVGYHRWGEGYGYTVGPVVAG